MVTPTTATARAETSMAMVRLMEGPETRIRTRTDSLEENGSQGTNMAIMVSLVSLVSQAEGPTTSTDMRTRLEEDDMARALRRGGHGPGQMELEDMARVLREEGSQPMRMEPEVEPGSRPTRGVEEEPPGPPLSAPS